MTSDLKMELYIRTSDVPNNNYKNNIYLLIFESSDVKFNIIVIPIISKYIHISKHPMSTLHTKYYQ